jgi:hypothetical protein
METMIKLILRSSSVRLLHFLFLLTNECTGALKLTWRSPIYSFFQSAVEIKYENGRLYHFFACAARQCKTPARGVRRFQDKQDKNSTANLKAHAIKCFGAEAVNNAIKGSNVTGQNGSVFTQFARRGQQPVNFSYRAHTNEEARYVVFCILYS